MKAKNPQRWFIYRMRCLIGGVGDYIGLTHNPFQREAEHRAKKRGYKLTAAIHLYGEKNFVYEILEECDTEDQAREIERRYIKELGTGWPSGLNVSGAGEGVRADQYEMRRAAQIKSWEDEEKRKLHSERLKRAMNTTTAKQRNSEAAKRRWADPEYRAKHVAAAASFKHTEETKQNLREQKLAASAARGGPKDRRKYPGLSNEEIGRLNRLRPEVETKVRATWESNREKNVASIRAANAIHNRDPAKIAKRTAGIKAAVKKRGKITLSPETREKMSAAHTERWARIKLLQNPEGTA